MPQRSHPQALESKGRQYLPFPGPHREFSRRKCFGLMNLHLFQASLASLRGGRLQLEFRNLALFSGLFYANLLFMAWDTGFPCKAMTLMRL